MTYEGLEGLSNFKRGNVSEKWDITWKLDWALVDNTMSLTTILQTASSTKGATISKTNNTLFIRLGSPLVPCIPDGIPGCFLFSLLLVSNKGL